MALQIPHIYQHESWVPGDKVVSGWLTHPEGPNEDKNREKSNGNLRKNEAGRILPTQDFEVRYLSARKPACITLGVQEISPHSWLLLSPTVFVLKMLLHIILNKSYIWYLFLCPRPPPHGPAKTTPRLHLTTFCLNFLFMTKISKARVPHLVNKHANPSPCKSHYTNHHSIHWSNKSNKVRNCHF